MRRWTPIFVAVLCLMASANALACPFCKDSVPSSDAQAPGGLPAGFNNTIYLMLGALVAVLAMVTFTLVKGARTSVPSKAASSPRGSESP